MSLPSTIYLDNNATTRPRPEVLDAMHQAFEKCYGNPGSRHREGRTARQALENARESIARVLNADPNEVVFTSGGTESSNMALFGLASGSTGTIALPPGEHPATEESVRVLESRGWQRLTLALDSEGRLHEEQFRQQPWDAVRLATVLLAHNETGTIQDLTSLSGHCRAQGIPLHVDAVQAAGKIGVDFRELGATTLAIGAHKLCGPRGIGALLIQDGVELAVTQYGGHQEAGRRPGTECVALAVGMARALELWYADREEEHARIAFLRDRLEAGLLETCEPAVVNGSPAHRLPNTLSIAFPGCDGDALLVALDLAGICCSLGSTCASGSSEPAPILVAMGCPPDVVHSTLRFSLGRETTQEEVDDAVQRIAAVVDGLRNP